MKTNTGRASRMGEWHGGGHTHQDKWVCTLPRSKNRSVCIGGETHLATEALLLSLPIQVPFGVWAEAWAQARAACLLVGPAADKLLAACSSKSDASNFAPPFRLARRRKSLPLRQHVLAVRLVKAHTIGRISMCLAGFGTARVDAGTRIGTMKGILTRRAGRRPVLSVCRCGDARALRRPKVSAVVTHDELLVSPVVRDADVQWTQTFDAVQR